MATAADAELILKIYDIRREEVMRKARAAIAFEFAPTTVDEFKAIHAPSHPMNAYWRQVISFNEQICTIALSGAIDMDLFAETQSEAFFLRAKYHEFSEAATGNTFMPKALAVIEKAPAAKATFDRVTKMFADRKAAAAK